MEPPRSRDPWRRPVATRRATRRRRRSSCRRRCRATGLRRSLRRHLAQRPRTGRLRSRPGSRGASRRRSHPPPRLRPCALRSVHGRSRSARCPTTGSPTGRPRRRDRRASAVRRPGPACSEGRAGADRPARGRRRRRWPARSRRRSLRAGAAGNPRGACSPSVPARRACRRRHGRPAPHRAPPQLPRARSATPVPARERAWRRILRAGSRTRRRSGAYSQDECARGIVARRSTIRLPCPSCRTSCGRAPRGRR